jgi:hypothetical protein
MTQLWQCCKRTGLPEKDALALLGFHPFAGSWSDPQAAEQRSAADQLRFNNAFFRYPGLNAHVSSAFLGVDSVEQLLTQYALSTQIMCRQLLEMGGNGMPTLLNDPALRALAQAWADNLDLYTEVGQLADSGEYV